MSFSFDEAQKRIPSQIEKIINALREAGEEGLTTRQLNEICFRYGARISDLYQRGYKIEVIPIEKGLYKYVLRGVPSQVTIHPNAQDEFLFALQIDLDQESAEIASGLLDSMKFKVVRQPNYYRELNN